MPHSKIKNNAEEELQTNAVNCAASMKAFQDALRQIKEETYRKLMKNADTKRKPISKISDSMPTINTTMPPADYRWQHYSNQNQQKTKHYPHAHRMRIQCVDDQPTRKKESSSEINNGTQGKCMRNAMLQLVSRPEFHKEHQRSEHSHRMMPRIRTKSYKKRHSSSGSTSSSDTHPHLLRIEGKCVRNKQRDKYKRRNKRYKVPHCVRDTMLNLVTRPLPTEEPREVEVRPVEVQPVEVRPVEVGPVELSKQSTGTSQPTEPYDSIASDIAVLEEVHKVLEKQVKALANRAKPKKQKRHKCCTTTRSTSTEPTKQQSSCDLLSYPLSVAKWLRNVCNSKTSEKNEETQPEPKTTKQNVKTKPRTRIISETTISESPDTNDVQIHYELKAVKENDKATDTEQLTESTLQTKPKQESNVEIKTDSSDTNTSTTTDETTSESEESTEKQHKHFLYRPSEVISSNVNSRHFLYRPSEVISSNVNSDILSDTTTNTSATIDDSSKNLSKKSHKSVSFDKNSVNSNKSILKTSLTDNTINSKPSHDQQSSENLKYKPRKRFTLMSQPRHPCCDKTITLADGTRHKQLCPRHRLIQQPVQRQVAHYGDRNRYMPRQRLYQQFPQYHRHLPVYAYSAQLDYDQKNMIANTIGDSLMPLAINKPTNITIPENETTQQKHIPSKEPVDNWKEHSTQTVLKLTLMAIILFIALLSINSFYAVEKHDLQNNDLLSSLIMSDSNLTSS